MAQTPDQLPESIVLGQFSGIRNTVTRERLKQDELEAAVNVDFDDTGQASRRGGRRKVLSGDVHSVKTIGGRTLAVVDKQLGWIDTAYQFHGLGFTAGAEKLSYTQVGDITFFASLATSGKIIGDEVLPWGGDASGEWLSPVITPTDTLGAVFGTLLTPPPRAEHIAGYRGRIYLAAGRYAWGTELWMFDYIDKTRNFLQFEEDITMMAPVDDGIYFGTKANLWFLSGTLSDGFQRRNILEYGVIPGSLVSAPTTDIHPNARNAPFPENMGILFMTERGIAAGFDEGQVFDLTHGRVEFPAATAAASLYRSDSGGSSYVAVADSAGGPAANARIGDYVDAEIVKRGG